MTWAKILFIQICITAFLLIFIELLALSIFFIYKGHTLWFKPRSEVIFVNDHLSKHHIKNSTMKLAKFPAFNADLQINEYGLISTTNEVLNLAPKLLLIGGSTVEGRGSSSNNTTIASYLSKCLASASIPFEVLNAGRSGSYSYTEYRILLESFLPAFKPDLVISLNGRNDFYYSLKNKHNEFYYHSDVRNSDTLISQDIHGIKFFDYVRDIYLSSHFSRLVASIINKLKNEPGIYKINEKMVKLENIEMQMRTEEAVRQFNVQISNTKNIVEAYGANYMHFIQPTLMSENREITDAEKSFISSWEKRTVLGKSFQYDLINFYKTLKNQNNKISIDISQLFDEKDHVQLYVDTVHYNDHANELIADKICENIEKSTNNYLIHGQR